MSRHDPHSFADDAQPVGDFLSWRARVDFQRHTLTCESSLRFRQPSSPGPLDLDSRDLDIQSIVDQNEHSLTFEVGAPEAILGSRVRVELPGGTSQIRIAYETKPGATALQWLEPAQTDGGRQPFLYTQCQPIHARSIVPLQDTPRTRLRFEAELDVPYGLTPLMAAESLGQERQGDRLLARFRLPQPVAPYLFAFAVGELESRDLSPRCRVWAEPGLVERAAWEFADTERMLATGEALFGDYDWERYDILVLPPAFPYGGMENPRLTFLTPSILAGDRSLVAVVAHELAHSWTGNLISNANAEHFWLNEGGATYAERRIVEAMWGVDAAELNWALGRRELEDALRQLTDDGHPEWTRLRTELAGIDPDDAYTFVPYEKGALLLRSLEQAAGRTAFDGFLREYIHTFRFGALTTEEFVAFLREHLPTDVDLRSWLYEPALPDDVPMAESARLDAIVGLGVEAPSDGLANGWSATEWQIYIDGLAPAQPQEFLKDLDRRFGLTNSTNFDVLEKWLTLAIRSGFEPAFGRADEVLGSMGRMKYLRPLYRALNERDPNYANALFQRNAAQYHPIARQVIEGLLHN
jgi:leukotriene-A4 hydrolase